MRSFLPCLFRFCLLANWVQGSEADLFVPVVSPSEVVLSPAGSPGPIRLGSGGLSLLIQPSVGSALATNAPALAAFNRAAATWASYISDDITIVIDADLLSFGAGNENVIGGATPVYLQGNYSAVAGLLAGDAADESDDGIVSMLPSSLSIRSLTGIAFSGNVLLTKANAKALGLPASYVDGLVNTTIDARIEFNSDFAFSYDRSSAAPGTIDFESVALHEIGHALGFISQADTVDGIPIGTNLTGATLSVTTLDLFRFAATNKPVNEMGFTSGVRELTPGIEAGISDGVDYFAMSTGVSRGDGRQASHWKDGNLPGNSLIGGMDPTIDYGQIFTLSRADLRALDLIGYDISPVPEPTFACGVIGLLGLISRRRRD
ncbi:MAG: hypothetical protein CFE26_00910 [Verrucomicrobiales bacterium VVV1]|nr:MAG: hypothetical protein CFE26_00910 [Verrucomicrobiales bacterium VVV1]